MHMTSREGEVPAAQGHEPAAGHPERFTHPPGSLCHHVLVVDDDVAFARTVADALNDRDIEAVAVSDPREALAARPTDVLRRRRRRPDHARDGRARARARAAPRQSRDRGRAADRPRGHALRHRGDPQRAVRLPAEGLAAVDPAAAGGPGRHRAQRAAGREPAAGERAAGDDATARDPERRQRTARGRAPPRQPDRGAGAGRRASSWARRRCAWSSRSATTSGT